MKFSSIGPSTKKFLSPTDFGFFFGYAKPFKTKNQDKIDLDATNSNLEKSCDRDSRATINNYVDLQGGNF